MPGSQKVAGLGRVVAAAGLGKPMVHREKGACHNPVGAQIAGTSGQGRCQKQEGQGSPHLLAGQGRLGKGAQGMGAPSVGRGSPLHLEYSPMLEAQEGAGVSDSCPPPLPRTPTLPAGGCQHWPLPWTPPAAQQWLHPAPLCPRRTLAECPGHHRPTGGHPKCQS